MWDRADGAFGLRFGGVADDVVADHVALCLPFTALRRVDLSGLSLSAKKRALHRRPRHGHERQGAAPVRRAPGRYGSWNGDVHQRRADVPDLGQHAPPARRRRA